MKNDTTFVRMRTGDHMGDAKMSKKGTSLRRIYLFNEWDVCKSPGFPSNRVVAGQVDPAIGTNHYAYGLFLTRLLAVCLLLKRFFSSQARFAGSQATHTLRKNVCLFFCGCDRRRAGVTGNSAVRKLCSSAAKFPRSGQEIMPLLGNFAAQSDNRKKGSACVSGALPLQLVQRGLFVHLFKHFCLF